MAKGRISINRAHGGWSLLSQGFSLSEGWALPAQGVPLKLSLKVLFLRPFGILFLLSRGVRGDIHLGQVPSL